MGRIVLAGEGMIELARNPASLDGWTLGYGGDVLNTAIHLARFGDPVALLSALGDDPFSLDLRERWTAEGIQDDLILAVPAAHPGLYAIRTDDAGERSFTYWRGESAARLMFTLPESPAAIAEAAKAELFVFSLISLAILPPEGRTILLDLARRVRRNGGHVAFDGNYRPRLWADPGEARAWRDQAIACCSIGLPTFEDEVLLGGATTQDDVAAHWGRLGAGEIVVKLGADGCRIDGGIIAPEQRLRPLDTSGAGDAFNAGYLHARLSGDAPEAAAAAGHRIAAWVLMRPGAVPARDNELVYAE